jgi:radical SAM protein with 4Fe4S-binding SPASM domain
MNISELPKYIEMMDKMGVHHIRFIQMKLVGRSLKNQLRSIPFDEAFELLFPLLKDNPKLQAKCVDSTIGSLAVLIRLCPKYRSCGLGRSATMIHSNGDVYSCASTAGHPQFKAGNIREEKFSEIWRNSSVLKKLWEETNIDTLNPRCACCKIRYMCAGGCRGESWREYGALNQPAVNCHDIQRSTFKIMWMLAEAPDYFRNYAEWMMTKIPPAQTRDLLPPCIIPLTPCT